MAMTPEQKKLNKQAQLARDRAYRVRAKAWQAALGKALAPIPLIPEDVVPNVEPAQVSRDAWAADEALSVARAAARAEEDAIQAQIEQLQEKLKGASKRHKLEELADARRQMYDKLRAVREKAEDEVAAEYADVAGVFSAVEWARKTGFDSTK